MDTVDLQVKSVWLSWALGHNPLVRRSDRMEAAFIALVAAVLVLFIPVACAVGTTVHETQARYLADYQGTHRQVSAEVIEQNVGPAELYTPGALVRVQWTHLGRTRSDVMFAQDKPKVGDALTIWVDDRGDRTPPPPDPAVPMLTAVTAAASLWLGAAAVAGALLTAQRMWLNRRRYAGWESEYRTLVG